MLFKWSEIKEDDTHYTIKACGDWMLEHVLKGWRPYFIVIMFKPLNGSRDAVIAQMKRGIEKDFYSSLVKRFSRHPNQPSQQDRLPRLWLFPDLPVRKSNKKTSIDDMQFNHNGLHYNGILLLPPKSRFKADVVKHFDGYQDVYIRWPIERINVQEIQLTDLNYVADYSGKTMYSRRVSQDDIIILPDTRRKDAPPVLNEENRALKSIQTQHNVSEEIARQMLGSEPERSGVST